MEMKYKLVLFGAVILGAGGVGWPIKTNTRDTKTSTKTLIFNNRPKTKSFCLKSPPTAFHFNSAIGVFGAQSSSSSIQI